MAVVFNPGPKDPYFVCLPYTLDSDHRVISRELYQPN